jgi:hypothetical protein
MSFSPQNLGFDQYQESARVVSIVMFKYDFPKENVFYSAHAIVEGIAKIPGPSTSTFRCDVDDLKLALANWSIRRSVRNFFKGRIDYQKSAMNEDIILHGDHKFIHGYQIKFRKDGIIRRNDIREDISSLREYIMKDLTAGRELSPENDHRKRLESNINTSTTIEEDESDIDDNESSFEMEVKDDANKKRKGRPRENNSERELLLAYNIKKFKMKEGYKKKIQSVVKSSSDFDIDESDEKITIRNKSLALISLIKSSGSYFQDINGKKNCLSITSGLFVQQMYSEGISQNKLPNVIAAVVNMLVGKIDDNATSYIVKAPSTYMKASERVYDIMKSETYDKFNTRNSECYISVHVMLDASCKQGKSCVGKILIVVGDDEIIKQICPEARYLYY